MTVRPGVQSSHLVDRVQDGSIRPLCPDFADEFVGCESANRFEPSGAATAIEARKCLNCYAVRLMCHQAKFPHRPAFDPLKIGGFGHLPKASAANFHILQLIECSVAYAKKNGRPKGRPFQVFVKTKVLVMRPHSFGRDEASPEDPPADKDPRQTLWPNMRRELDIASDRVRRMCGGPRGSWQCHLI